jgi:dienelactone hydrolase
LDTVSEQVELGVVERRFSLEVNGQVVPGLHWTPETATATPYPTVLIGHGGTQHKRAPNVLALARTLVRHCGFGAVALDAPGHGDRMTDEDRERRRELLRARADGATPQPDPRRRFWMDSLGPQVVNEWKALLDELQLDERWRGEPVGYWGVSMGTSFGLPLVASEPRVTAAVLGLNALRNDDGERRDAAGRITQPVLFLFQWDDELMTREGGIALWDALGSEEKTMHINPGCHVAVPRFEVEASVAFFTRHLGGSRSNSRVITKTCGSPT